MAIRKNNNSGLFHYTNEIKQNKNFMYSNLRRSNCYGTDFTGSNFDYSSFRGAHFKSCNFFDCSFTYTEFIGTNFRKSKFKRAKFENCVFEGVNLDGANFRDAEFKNVIFVGTSLSLAKEMEFSKDEVKIYDSMPEIAMSDELKEAFKSSLSNECIKKSRVLDTKEGEINTVSVMLLLGRFSEDTLISGLNVLKDTIDKDFFTLSYIIKAIQKLSEN